MAATKITLRAEAQNRVEAVRALAQALTERGFKLIPDGDKFMYVLPAGGPGTPMPAAAKPAIATNQVALNPEEIIPRGMLVFTQADLSQVLDIYSEITCRTVLRHCFSSA